MDLWPENLLEDFDKVKAPANILKEQGFLLGEKTQNLINGEVRTIVDNPYESYDDKFNFMFSIVAPTIRYSYELLKISYDITFYPIEVDFEGKKTTFNTEKDFIDTLKKVFSSSKTKRVVQALLSQLEYRSPNATQHEEDDIPF